MASSSLVERVHRVREMAQSRDDKTSPAPKKEPTPTPSAKVIQLPLWPEPVRGTPNAWLRGALFAAIQGKDRRALKREVLASIEGFEIRLQGFQLDQSDLGVWEVLIHLVRQQGMGNRVEFTAYALLKALGRNTGKSDREWLKDVLARLGGAFVEITSDNLTFAGALLTFARDELTGHYVLWLEPRMLALYQSGWTQIESGARDALRRKPLALWLHGWYASHAKPYPVKVETIHRLCGSGTKELWRFKQALCKALDDIKAVGVIDTWEIIDDVVHVERNPTQSQQKHLAKKVEAGRKPKK